jgi:hypothetical protein
MDDAPGDPDRDCTPANRLYDSMGFQELDRLWSFTRSYVLDAKAYTPGTFEGWLYRITTNLFLDRAPYVQRVGGFSGSESSRSSLRSQPISDEESSSGADDSDRVSAVRSRAVS